MSLARPWTRVWQLILTHRWRLIGLFVAVLLPLAGFGWLAGELLDEEHFFFDEPILRYLYSLASPRLDVAMIWLSRLGYQWGVVPLDAAILGWLVLRRQRRDTLFFALAVGGAGLLNYAAKLLFGRLRPDLWLSLTPEPGFSFPSGHAMGSMALFAALLVLLWPTRWRWPLLLVGGLLVFLVGLSRVHYPSDVLAGWAASLTWVMGLSHIFYRRLGRPATSRREIASEDALVSSRKSHIVE